jgi:hypothetical protein
MSGIDGERKIDALGDRGKIRIDRTAPQFLALRIDQVKLGREAAMAEVVVDFLRPAAAAGI